MNFYIQEGVQLERLYALLHFGREYVEGEDGEGGSEADASGQKNLLLRCTNIISSALYS